ncbi:MAG TPA: HmuY family protein, partial [Ohtaekwangia sp.]|uniref:HmuY family protein n=1 Tax=Ohtaekwangia sp. TaxID=2066019 RepID=UPI002F920196
AALTLSLFMTLLINACSDDDPPLPDNLATFTASAVGLEDDADEATIAVTLTRAVDAATTVTIDLTATGVTYGTDFTTDPAASGNILTITIPAAGNTASFKVVRSEGVFLTGDEKVTFKISSVGEPLLIGTTAEVTLSFSSIVSEGSELTLNGLIGSEAGSSAGNSVFVDFSNNQQTPVARSSWDLGFYMGDDFRVILNNTTTATARVIDKNDLTTVVASDSTPASNWSLGFDAASFALVDNVLGDLSQTVIASVSATDADNKVYIINRGTGGSIAARPWYKVRILRKSDGYTLQYARINETTYKSIDVTKDSNYTFKYISFDNGAVSVAPEKDQWDIEWTYAVYETDNGGTMIPYAFSDLVYINAKGGVTAAQILNTESVTYDTFTSSNLTGIAFASNIDVIGSNWRVTSPAASAGVKTDRFYLVKDGAGNIYKLKFVSFHPNDGGTRGKPVVKYELVQKAS